MQNKPRGTDGLPASAELLANLLLEKASSAALTIGLAASSLAVSVVVSMDGSRGCASNLQRRGCHELCVIVIGDIMMSRAQRQRAALQPCSLAMLSHVMDKPEDEPGLLSNSCKGTAHSRSQLVTSTGNIGQSLLDITFKQTLKEM